MSILCSIDDHLITLIAFLMSPIYCYIPLYLYAHQLIHTTYTIYLSWISQQLT